VPAAWPLTDRSKELRFIEAAISDRDSSGICPHRRGHVYRAMTKTGTTSRQEMAALLTARAPESP
jgi:hypothetical protein